MTIIDYYQQDYHSFLKDIAPKIKGVFKEPYLLHFNQEPLSGYARANKIHDQFTYLIMDMRTTREVMLNLIPDKGDYYILLLQLVEALDKHESILEKELYFTHTGYAQKLVYPANARVRMLSLCIHESWLKEKLPSAEGRDRVKEITGGYVKSDLDAEYRYIFDDVLKMVNTNPLSDLHENNRVMQLLEMFFKRTLKKKMQSQAKTLKPDEMRRLSEVEKILCAHFNSPAPPLKKLSRLAGMSESSLKMKFKMIYGSGISVYHRRCKMLKAKQMLQSGKYSVKEVGMELGYSNLGHFSGAFKKEFNVLPSELMILNRDELN